MEEKRLPNYRTISKELHQDILNELYKEHQKLPSERELMERFSVSRMTIRQAVDYMITQGFVYRIAGRGAFVSSVRFLRDNKITSFTQSMKELDYPVSNEVLLVEKKKATKEVAQIFQLQDHEEVYHLVRIRYAQKIAMAYETLYVPERLFPDFERFDFKHDSLYRIYQEEYGQKFQYDEEEVSAAYVHGEIAQALYGKKSGVSLKITGTLYNQHHEAIEYGSSYYHYDRYRYHNVSVK